MVERVRVKLIRQQVKKSEMQIDFIQGCGATYAIFILGQLQHNNTQPKKDSHFAFLDLEKTFDQVTASDLNWWILKKLGTEEWLVRFVQSIQRNA